MGLNISHVRAFLQVTRVFGELFFAKLGLCVTYMKCTKVPNYKLLNFIAT